MSIYWLKRYYQELSYDSVCIKWIEEANTTKLRKSTGSIRTQYPIERKLWSLFDYEMKIHNTRDVKQTYFPNRLDEWEEEKTRIYNNMRRTLLTVNQIINDREAEKLAAKEAAKEAAKAEKLKVREEKKAQKKAEQDAIKEEKKRVREAEKASKKGKKNSDAKQGLEILAAISAQVEV